MFQAEPYLQGSFLLGTLLGTLLGIIIEFILNEINYIFRKKRVARNSLRTIIRVLIKELDFAIKESTLNLSSETKEDILSTTKKLGEYVILAGEAGIINEKYLEKLVEESMQIIKARTVTDVKPIKDQLETFLKRLEDC